MTLRELTDSGLFTAMNEALAPLGVKLTYGVLPGGRPDDGGGLLVRETGRRANRIDLGLAHIRVGLAELRRDNAESEVVIEKALVSAVVPDA